MSIYGVGGSSGNIWGANQPTPGTPSSGTGPLGALQPSGANGCYLDMKIFFCSDV